MQYTVNSIEYTVYSMQYTVYSIQYAIYIIQYTVYSMQYTVYSIQYTVYMLVQQYICRYSMYGATRTLSYPAMQHLSLATLRDNRYWLWISVCGERQESS